MAVLLTLGALALGEYHPHTYLKGDCPYYAAVTLSLLQDGDFDLRNQLQGGLEVHSRQISLGVRGEWFPKHPVLMPILTLPFTALFGLPGTLLFNLTVMLLLFVVMVRISAQFTTLPVGLLAALLVTFTTFLPAYAYNYSPDLFASLLVLSGLTTLFRGNPLLGGALLGAATWAKLPCGIFFLIAFLYLALQWSWRSGGFFLLGGLPPLSVMGAIQQRMFGSPWVTGYDRTILLEEGRRLLFTHRDYFDYPLWRGIREQLLDPERGLLVTAPLLLLALPGFILFFRKRPAEAGLVLSACGGLFLLFSKYRFWSSSHAGNRFLIPLVCLSVLPLGFLFERGLLWSRTVPRSRIPRREVLR